ncbi:DsbE family thiol:disulfide interchange protein [Iodobacter fluviatilis]|uniref:Cytochrome c biogenesis protein CcmG/thiol:disulfide interchange protein DsbE n=1 Tax=Iodobacter fluviatilis TaxID=537 RepID=A0A377Q9K6_9NEIS|nr:DsbE family thiol:disulfide interchange protein [Iodobacter fluviatilis]TCU82378.1 cytochrome c biogenesis protein CcmG/thiol:disulfide interchange protein DsbE [Iodobacter fluviatilis]STQ91603.1 Cytochrome c biogenesis protein CycY [Iodobacter fluviatilis]
MKRFAPLIIFAALALLLAAGLTLNPREIPSVLIGKPAPQFKLDRLDATGQFSPASLKGQAWLLNVWASWCSACIQEHPVLNSIASEHKVTIVGLAYKDLDMDAKQWLQSRGNPYNIVVADRDGRVGIDYGVYGVPETFVIDKNGHIAYKHIGAVTPDIFKNILLPELQKARR